MLIYGICEACKDTGDHDNNFAAAPVTPTTAVPAPAPQQQGGEFWVEFAQGFMDGVTSNDDDGGVVWHHPDKL
ncbi:unnamed protein product [Aphanomyces euteiches]